MRRCFHITGSSVAQVNKDGKDFRFKCGSSRIKFILDAIEIIFYPALRLSIAKVIFIPLFFTHLYLVSDVILLYKRIINL